MNKNSCLATALGLTKMHLIIGTILVLLKSDSDVEQAHLRTATISTVGDDAAWVTLTFDANNDAYIYDADADANDAKADPTSKLEISDLRRNPTYIKGRAI